MTIPKELGHKVYDILEDIGASPRMRMAFVDDESRHEIHEWRFEGKLGFGGKFWNEWSYIDKEYQWRVSCYSEDENPERLKIIEETNLKLNQLISTL